ncbi:MAG: hypothetical protein PHW76_05580 [Alphaproteobacteria bacterium]|nr:hypothetical protein [Alphaproteobacteria bacterium]
MTIQIQQDGKGNEYVRVENIRITYLPACSWDPSSPGLRIQAYRDNQTDALHQGAEIPIKNQQTALDVIAAIASLIK